MALNTALFLAFAAVLFSEHIRACPIIATHSCEKDTEPVKCVAQVTCTVPRKEPCGKNTCTYPYICVAVERPECSKLEQLRATCRGKSVCKEARKRCGRGSCGANQDCVMDTVCSVKEAAVKRRRLLRYEGEASDPYTPYESVLYEKNCHYCSENEALECMDNYVCVAKESCRDIVIQQCIQKSAKPGVDLAEGGLEFSWTNTNHAEKNCAGQPCGDEQRCADVSIQRCKQKCGETECGHGYECVIEGEGCEDLQYLESICRDVSSPTCMRLPPNAEMLYTPPCKTIYECELQHSTCGNTHCGEGNVCLVEHKKSCEIKYNTTLGLPIIELPATLDITDAKPFPDFGAQKERGFDLGRRAGGSSDALKEEVPGESVKTRRETTTTTSIRKMSTQSNEQMTEVVEIDKPKDNRDTVHEQKGAGPSTTSVAKTAVTTAEQAQEKSDDAGGAVFASGQTSSDGDSQQDTRHQSTDAASEVDFGGFEGW